jgi:hypothetical protein
VTGVNTFTGTSKIFIKVQNTVDIQGELNVSSVGRVARAGGFDGAVGEYEKVLKYLDPLSLKIKTPIMIIGLSKPKSFKVEHFKDPKNQKSVLGKIIKF